MNVTLFVEHLCNLRCSYCYTGDKFRRTMTEEVIRASADLALSDQAPVVTLGFFGGEPLLRFDLLKRATELYRERFAQLEAKVPQLKIVLNTNATLLTPEVIEWMVEYGVVSNVSLDGPQSVHDRMRVDAKGRGSYEQAQAGIRRLENANLQFQLTSVISPSTAAEMGEIVQEGLNYQSFRHTLAPDLSAAWDEESIESFKRGAYVAAEAWGAAFRAGKSVRLEPLQTKVLSHVLGGCATAARCSMSLKEVTVAPSGNLYNCAQLVGEDKDASLRIGHVREGIDQGAVARLRETQSAVSAICAPCELRARCSADCGCKQVSAAGVLGRIDGILCDTEEAFIKAADQMAEELFAEQCPAFMDFVYRTRWKLREGAQLSQLRRRAQS